MPDTVDPRLVLMSRLNDPPYDGVAGKRGTPMGEAAQLIDDGEHDPDCLVDELRSMASAKTEA